MPNHPLRGTRPIRRKKMATPHKSHHLNNPYDKIPGQDKNVHLPAAPSGKMFNRFLPEKFSCFGCELPFICVLAEQGFTIFDIPFSSNRYV
ncbi:MAG: hypothetical protein Q8S57_07245 [Methanoregula sp.]|nr:hypothetical protein [Methanoregula sp.]